jgi:hypothetical protein
MLLSSLVLSFVAQQAPVQLDLPQGLPERFQTAIEVDGQRVTLQLQRRSLRAKDFILENSDGPILDIPESRTYFGVIKELPGSAIAASLEPYGLRASIFMPDDALLRLTPNRVRGNGWHTIAAAEAPPLEMCGIEETPLKKDKLGAGSGNRSVSVPPPSGGSHYLSPYPWQWTMRKSRIGFDATYAHWIREGQTVAGVTASVEYQLAENDLVCSRDAMVSYELTGIVIRQSPFYVSTTSYSMLPEFANEWANNQQHIPYESAVLLADYQNDGIAGLAYVGTLGGWGYAGLFWDRGYSPGIIAHEIGHNWGCGHIDCWPWGGSAMCGSWLLYGPESTDIIQWRANDYLKLTIIDPYETPVRPYANPDWVEADSQADNKFDVLANDYDANFDYLHISGVDPSSDEGATLSIISGGPGGRDMILYQPDRTRLAPYSDSFWYAASDFGGLEHWTPVTVEVGERNLVATYKFEEGSGAELLDSSTNEHHIHSSGPIVFAETHDPVVRNECNSTSWEDSSNLFDNNDGSVFASSDQGVVSANFTTDPADGTWLELDFGAPTTFDGWRHNDQDLSRKWIGKSILYFSQDRFFDSNDIAIEISHQNHGELVTYPFDATTARFVRWEVTQQYDPISTLHSLGGAEMSFVYDSDMVELLAPSVTLSSNSQTGNGAANLVDNDATTSFISDSQGVVSSALSTNPNDGTWIELDYHSAQSFEGASFLDLSNSGAYVTESTLWFSNSSTFSASDPSVTINHINQGQSLVIDFAAIQARYVRWEITNTSFSFIKDNGGRELALFGDPTLNPPFQRVAGPFGDSLDISNKISAKATIGAPTSSNQTFTLNVYLQTPAVLDDGALICGIGDTGASAARYFEIRNNSLHFAGIDTGFSLATNAWVMLTASYNGSELRLYNDAILLGTYPISLAESDASIQLAPENPNYATAFFEGLIDEYSVWDYSMSDSEISELMTGGAACGPTPFDTQRNILNSPRLEWVAALNAPQHDVYLGTDYYAVRDASTSSSTYVGRQSNDYLDLQNLSPGEWHYWRVDEVHANGDIIPSKVWRFKTHLPWTTVVSEGFGDGNSGDHLNGLMGGSGFSSPWSAPTNNEYIRYGGSIGAYPSNVPLTETDGYLQRRATSSLPMEGQRMLDSAAVEVDMSGDTSIYLSFALGLNGSSLNMSAMVGLFDSATGDTILMGSDDGSWAISGAAGDITGNTAPRNNTQFVVVRIDANNQSDDVISMKIYNSASDMVHQSDSLLSGSGNGNDQWDLVSTTGNANGVFNHLFIRAGAIGSSLGTNNVVVDEIKIGGNWTDVTGL